MTIEQLANRIELLKQQQQQIVVDANRQLGAIDGQIAILQEWLAALQAAGSDQPE